MTSKLLAVNFCTPLRYTDEGVMDLDHHTVVVDREFFDDRTHPTYLTHRIKWQPSGQGLVFRKKLKRPLRLIGRNVETNTLLVRESYLDPETNQRVNLPLMIIHDSGFAWKICERRKWDDGIQPEDRLEDEPEVLDRHELAA